MAVRTLSENLQLAKQIKAKLGLQIDIACDKSHLVVPEFLAGLISVENSRVSSLATRFEPGVYSQLRNLRDFGVIWHKGLPRRNYNGITRAQLKGMSDDALRNLATSYSYTQIMGWHVMTAPLASYSISELRSSERHLRFAVMLLEHDCGQFLKTKDYPAVLRIWNTGKPKGETHDPFYVANAVSVAQQYRLL